jgi:hypothetical protein
MPSWVCRGGYTSQLFLQRRQPKWRLHRRQARMVLYPTQPAPRHLFLQRPMAKVPVALLCLRQTRRTPKLPAHETARRVERPQNGHQPLMALFRTFS